MCSLVDLHLYSLYLHSTSRTANSLVWLDHYQLKIHSLGQLNFMWPTVDVQCCSLLFREQRACVNFGRIAKFVYTLLHDPGFVKRSGFHWPHWKMTGHSSERCSRPSRRRFVWRYCNQSCTVICVILRTINKLIGFICLVSFYFNFCWTLFKWVRYSLFGVWRNLLCPDWSGQLLVHYVTNQCVVGSPLRSCAALCIWIMWMD